jgi:methionyl-tRNA formyltransferase
VRIAIAGSGTLGKSLLNALLESRHEIVALVLNGRAQKGMRRTLNELGSRFLFPTYTMLGIAASRKIPLIYIDKMTEEELAPLRALDLDLLLVGGFSIILKEPLLSLPKLGCLNTHSALLPKHQGPNPFTAAILANDAETGVTFHKMDAGIDTGDIVEQVRMPVGPRQTAGMIYRDTSILAGEHVVRVIDRIEAEGLRGVPQNRDEALYDKKMDPKEMFIRWDKSAEEVDRLVRACMPFHIARLRFRGRPVYVYRSSFRDTPVEAAPGTVLQNSPSLRVATAQGVVTIETAYALKPIPWSWPSFFSRPRVGEILE